MIIFDRLQISDNGTMLYIDVHVNEADYFVNNTISRVVIKTSDQVSEADPLSPGDTYIYNCEPENSPKELHLALNAAIDFDAVFATLSDKLLFVYVICEGAPDECTPCRLDEMTTLGVTFDTTALYQRVMQYVRELDDDCNIPKGFIDLILLWNGFKAAIETEHYIPAIDFWKKMFVLDYHLRNVCKPKCGCHG